jgi:hypothetical protein
VTEKKGVFIFSIRGASFVEDERGKKWKKEKKENKIRR